MIYLANARALPGINRCLKCGGKFGALANDGGCRCNLTDALTRAELAKRGLTITAPETAALNGESL